MMMIVSIKAQLRIFALRRSDNVRLSTLIVRIEELIINYVYLTLFLFSYIIKNKIYLKIFVYITFCF